jgi:hypothetical protein
MCEGRDFAHDSHARTPKTRAVVELDLVHQRNCYNSSTSHDSEFPEE